MFCQECGTEFEGKFCPNCGTPSGAAKSTPPVQPPVVHASLPDQSDNRKPEKRKKKKGKGCLLPVLAGFIILVILFMMLGSSSGSNNRSSTPGSGAKTEHTQASRGSGSESEVENVPEDGSDPEKEAADGEVREGAVEEKAVSEKTVDYAVRQEFFNHYVTAFGSHLASAFVEIENTGNTPLYLHDGQFDVEDNNGHLLTTQTLVSTCPDALLPGEIGYFYSDYIDLSDVDDSNGLVFVPTYKVDEARYDIIDYEVSDLGIREDDLFKCKVSGRLTNTQDKEINLIYVYVIYYNSEGTVLGISGTNITDIQPGETTSFEMIGNFFYDGVEYSDIAEYKVIPRAWYMQF